ICGCKNVSLLKYVAPKNFFTIIGVSLKNGEESFDIGSKTSSFISGMIYTSIKNLYMAIPNFKSNVENTTIIQFSLRGTNISFEGLFEVNGTVLTSVCFQNLFKFCLLFFLFLF